MIWKLYSLKYRVKLLIISIYTKSNSPIFGLLVCPIMTVTYCAIEEGLKTIQRKKMLLNFIMTFIVI